MEIIQILIIIFAVFALTRAMLRLRDHDIAVSEFIFWICIWVIVVIIASIPGILQGVAEFLGLKSGINLLVYLSIIALFYLVFRLYVKIDHQEQQITSLVRHISYKDVKVNKKYAKKK